MDVFRPPHSAPPPTRLRTALRGRNPYAQLPLLLALVIAIGTGAAADLDPPLVEGVDPPVVYAGDGNVLLAIYGDNFFEPIQVQFSCQGNGPVIVGGPFIANQNEVHVYVDVPITAAPGFCTIAVQTPEGYGSCDACLEIVIPEPPPPTITNVTPDQVTQGDEDVLLTIEGNDFIEPLEVFFSCDGILIQNQQVISDQEIQVTIDVEISAAPGPCDVSVATAGGSDDCPGCITITEGEPPLDPPTIEEISPETLEQGSDAADLLILGTGFYEPLEVTFYCTGVGASQILVISDTEMHVLVDVAEGATLGPCDVYVITEGGTEICSACITVVEPPPLDPPVITSVTPEVIEQGASGVLVEIIGTDFYDPLELTTSCPDLVLSGVTVVSETRIEATADVGIVAPPGPCDLQVTTEYGSDICSGCVTIEALPPEPPTIEEISPDELVQGDVDVLVTVTGTGFQDLIEVVLACQDVAVHSHDLISTTEIQLLVSVAADAPPGPCDLYVVTSGGTVICVDCVTIVEGLPPEPTIESVVPETLTQRDEDVAVTITGTGFIDPLGVTIPCDGVTTGAPSLINDTQVEVTVSVAADAALGPCDVQVAAAGGIVDCAGCIEILEYIPPPEPPSVTSVSPETIEQGQSGVLLEITGAGFVDPLTVATSCHGVLLSGVTAISDTQIEATADVDASTPAGFCDVSVTTDYGSGSCSGCLEIVAPPPAQPTITNVSPQTLTLGDEDVPVTITGTGFLAPLGVDLPCDGVSVISQEVVSDTEIEITVTVDEDAAVAPCDVVVDAAGGSAYCLGCIMIEWPPLPEPIIESVSPVTLTQGDEAIAVTIMGENFVESIDVTIPCDGVTVDSYELLGNNEIAATVSVATDAATGPCDVQVAAAGGTAVCSGCLVIVAPPPPEPTIDFVTPDELTRGEENVLLTISGSGFIVPSQAAFYCDGVTISSQEVISSTQIEVVVSAAADAASGPCAVEVTAPGGIATCDLCLTIRESTIPPQPEEEEVWVTLFAHAPCGDEGAPAPVPDSYPLLEWDYSATGIDADSLRFRLEIYPLYDDQAVDDAMTNYPIAILEDLVDTWLVLPTYIDALVYGAQYAWMIAAYDLADPAGTLAQSNQCVFIVGEEIPGETPTVPDEPIQDVAGEYLVLVSPGDPCEEVTGLGGYSSYSSTTSFTVRAAAEIAELRIPVWFNPCGRIPIDDLIIRTPDILIGGPLTDDTHGTITITESGSDYNVLVVTPPVYAADLICGGAYAWSALATLSGGTVIEGVDPRCFRNGDCGDTGDRESGPVTGPTVPREPDDPTGPPPETPGEPPPEYPYELLCRVCSPVIYAEQCDSIRIEPIVPKQPKTFEYPRAVPLLVIGDDTDYIVTQCVNCGESTHRDVAKDDIASYLWKLEGKGSLDQPFPDVSADQDSVLAILAQIAALEEELERIEDRIDALADEIDALQPDSVAAHAAMDSLSDRADELKDEATEAGQKVDALQALIGETRQKIDFFQEEISTLQDSLSNPPSQQEQTLGQQLAALREQLDGLQDQLADLMRNVQSQADAMIQQLVALQTQVDAARAELDDLTGQRGGMQDGISVLVSRLFSSVPELPAFRTAYSNFNYTYCGEQASDNGTTLQQFMDVAHPLVRALREERRDSLHTEAIVLLDRMMSAAARCCTGDDPYCRSQLTRLQIRERDLRDRLESIRDDGPPPATRTILASLDSLSAALLATQPRVRQLTGQITQQEQTLAQAQMALTQFLDQANAQQAQLQLGIQEQAREVSAKQRQLEIAFAERNAAFEEKRPGWEKELTEFSDSLSAREDQLATRADSLQTLIEEHAAAQQAALEAELEAAKARLFHERMVAYLAQLRAEKQRLEGQAKKIEEQIEELEKLLKQFQSNIAKVKPNQESTDQTVYYIPPPLDYLIAEKEHSQERFDSLKHQLAVKEAALEVAEERYADWQIEKYLLFERYARDVYRGKHLQIELEKLRKQFAGIERELQQKELDEKHDRLQSYRDRIAALEGALEELAQDIEEIQRKIEELEREITGLEERIDRLTGEIEEQRARETELASEIEDQLAGLRYQQEQRQRAEETYERRRAELQQARAQEEAAAQELRGIRTRMSAGTTGDDDEQVEEGRTELIEATARWNRYRETAEARQNELNRTAQTIQSLRTANDQVSTALDSLRKELGDLERERRSQEAEREVARQQLAAKKELLRILQRELKESQSQQEKAERKKREALQQQDEKVDDEIAALPDVKNIKAQRDEIEKTIKAKEEELNRLKTNLATHADAGASVRKDREEDREKAADDLEQARKELRGFLLAEIDSIDFTDTLHITLDDADLIFPDEPRRNERAILITYKARQVSFKVRILDGAGGGDQDILNPECVPEIWWEPTPGITLAGAAGPGREPRNDLLQYRDGEPLWDLWHQAPAGKIYRHEVIPLGRLFSDNDVERVTCQSSVCLEQSTSRSWPDVVYTTFGGAEFTNTEHAEKVLLKVPPIPKDPPLCDIEEKLFAIGSDSGLLAADPPKPEEVKYTHHQCTFVEKIDSTVVAAPRDTVELRVRLSDTAARGTAGEDIKVSILKAQPDDQTGHGLDEVGKLEEFYTTDGDGYIEFDLIFGEKFGKYEIEVDWIRNKDKPNTCEKFKFRAEVPLFHKLARCGFGPDPVTEALISAFNGKQTDIDAIDARADTTTGNREMVAVTVLHDARADSVNGLSIDFAGRSKKGAVRFDPASKASAYWGFARSVVHDHPDTVRLEAEAEVADKKLHPYTQEPRVPLEFSGQQADHFFIGSDKFKVVTDEPFTPGEPISGGGHFEIPFTSPRLQELVDGLVEVPLTISDVITDDALRATSGAVAWEGDAIGFGIGKRFKFEVNRVGVEAGAGGLLGGSVTFDTADAGGGDGAAGSNDSEEKTLTFQAYLGVEGDFVADIQSAPEFDFGFAVIQEGASMILDMSHKPNSLSAPVGREGHAWMGLYMRRLAVTFPTLMSADSPGGDPPGVFAENFYLGSEGGLNGKIGVTDAVRPMKLAGFSFTLKSFAATFDNGDLTACEAAGDIGLRDPLAGTLNTSVAITAAPSFAGEVKTEHPVAIPSWSLTLSLMEGCSFSYDEQAEVTLNFAAKSDYFEQMEIQGLKVNSDYEMSLEGFSYSGKPQKFMKAFQYQITQLAISRASPDDPYELILAGSLQFKELLGVEAGITICEGPSVSVDSVRIEYQKGPVELTVGLQYSDREFRGEASISIQPALEIEGLLAIGAAPKGDDTYYDYWYAELAVGTRIVLGQSGLAIFKLGGGVGMNYRPPIGDDPGGPDPVATFGLKALVDIGTLDGKAMMGRVTMVYAEPRFSLNGKLWVMGMEDNCYGEGQIDIIWDPRFQVSGYVRSVIALPTASGELIDFKGDIRYCFGGCGESAFYIRSKELSGTALYIVSAEGVIDINDRYCYLDGKLQYSFEKDVSVAGLGFYVNLGISYRGQVLICYADEVSLSAVAEFRGWADIDLQTWLGPIDVLSANVRTELALSYHNRTVCVDGLLEVSYNILGYSGDYDLSVSYPDDCERYSGCREG